MDVIEEEQQETAPVEAPSQLPDDRWLDDALKEFDDKTGQAEPPAGETDTNIPAENVSADELDKLLADLGAGDAPNPDQQRADGLQSQLNELQTQIHREREIAAYHAMADDLEKTVQEANPHVPDGWVKLAMDSYAHNREIALAFDYRGIDPKAAALDLAHVQVELQRLQADPNADPAQVQKLNTLAYQLDIAARSPAILRQCRNQILSEARKMKPPIDELATADHDAVAFAVREAHSGDIPEPPVNFGIMSDREFRDYTKKHFGF